MTEQLRDACNKLHSISEMLREALESVANDVRDDLILPTLLDINSSLGSRISSPVSVLYQEDISSLSAVSSLSSLTSVPSISSSILSWCQFQDLSLVSVTDEDYDADVSSCSN